MLQNLNDDFYPSAPSGPNLGERNAVEFFLFIFVTNSPLDSETAAVALSSQFRWLKELNKFVRLFTMSMLLELNSKIEGERCNRFRSESTYPTSISRHPPMRIRERQKGRRRVPHVDPKSGDTFGVDWHLPIPNASAREVKGIHVPADLLNEDEGVSFKDDRLKEQRVLSRCHHRKLEIAIRLRGCIQHSRKRRIGAHHLEFDHLKPSFDFDLRRSSNFILLL